MLGYTWKTRGIVFLVNLIVVGVSFVVGYFLDGIYETKPKLTFVFVILSFPVTQIITRKVLKKLLKKQGFVE